MPKQQATLQSFFGAAVGGVAGNKNHWTSQSENKNGSKKRVHVDEDEGVKTSRNLGVKQRIRRRVIDDDDDDDEPLGLAEDNDASMKNNESDNLTKVSNVTPSEKENKKEVTVNHGSTQPSKVDDVEESVSTKEVAGKTQVKEESKQEQKNDKVKPSKSTKVTPEFFQPKLASTKKEKGKGEQHQEEKEQTALKETPNPSAALPPPSDIYKLAASTIDCDEKVLNSIDSTLWPTGPLPYLVVCQVFAKIEEITGRLQIQELLTNLIRQVLLRQYLNRSDSADLHSLLYLASNEVAPAYQCVELGIGDSLLIKAIGETTGTAPNMVKQKYDSVGDLGTVAMTFKSKQKTLGGFFGSAGKDKSGLSATAVLEVFREIAHTKGTQAQKWKVDRIKKLLVKATDGLETKYIIRGLQGKLRIGLAQSTVLIALAQAFALTQVVPSFIPEQNSNSKNHPLDNNEEGQNSQGDEEIPEEVDKFMDTSLTFEKRLEGAVAIVKKAYSEVPSYDVLLDAIFSVPLEQLHKKCTLQPGIPVSPMLAKPTKSIQEVLKRLNGLLFTCEYKYDGERAQIHLLPDGTTKVFSRNLLDTSEKFPEVSQFVREACRNNASIQSFVMDAEVVAYNTKTGQLVPFQILSTRKKTQEANEIAKVEIIVQAFDLMYLNGQSLLRKTLQDRRQLLHEHFQSVEGKFQFAQHLDHKENGDTTVLEEFLDQAVKGQCEGLMIKTLNVNAVYEPSRRSLNWLKLKKDYLEGLGDSVDLVPLGAYHGKGKRTGVYGAYLLACYDPDSEEFQSVCKIGTGFSDEDLVQLAEALNQHVIPQKSSQYNVSDPLECDVWFDSVQVWEIKAADLSKSAVHRGAIGLTNDRGIGLRFPRFERLREDKKPVQATTSNQILEMYYNQDAVVSSGAGAEDDDDDGI